MSVDASQCVGKLHHVSMLLEIVHIVTPTHSTHCVPGTSLSALHTYVHFRLIKPSGVNSSHFVGEYTEAVSSGKLSQVHILCK